MNDVLKHEPMRITLPIVSAEEPSPPTDRAIWSGWQAVGDLPAVMAAPEPLEPQGAYGEANPVSSVPSVAGPEPGTAELLAPAGGLEAGYAALHFGADAVYLGLKKFSARAEAENFTLEEVEEITAYAHSFEPRRRIFVTINTLIRQDELAELVEAIATLAEIGVDALIIQDVGVYHLVRRFFPSLELHASTQLAVHNRAGANVLNQLGFQRVVLARELTFEEVRDITGTAGIETEVFIHGALCYSYSGLCLFSSQTLGRSGNRGKCAYSCRDSYEVQDAPLTLRDGQAVKRDPRQGFPFSMKDLALPDHLPALRSAGVSCFKIEGRKKSPLYVATTTDYYRRLLDGTLQPEDRPDVEADLQTVFSRPWTHLFVQSHRDKEVADRDTVGHRGQLIGKVEAALSGAEPRLRFRTLRALQRHDGLQVDLPILGKPFGFPVDRLWLLGTGRNDKRQEVFEAPAGSRVEVGLPREHPDLPLDAPVYCSSSQEVKQKYDFSRPKPGLFRLRRPVEVFVTLTRDRVTARASVKHAENGDELLAETCTLPGEFSLARDAQVMRQAVQETFEKLGSTGLVLAGLSVQNDGPWFVPVSQLNRLRRELTAEVEKALARRLQERIEQVQAEACAPVATRALEKTAAFRWSIKVDRLSFLEAFSPEELAEMDEIVIDIARDHPAILQERVEALGRDRVRLALPALTRAWEERGLRHKIDALRSAGWNRWEAANLSAWSYLGIEPRNGSASGLDLATDWSVYVLNRLAAHALLDLDVRRFALSPEDGLGNLGSLTREFGEQAVVIVYQDTPQFLAESCAYANLIGGCPGKANCRFESMEMVSSHGERVTALDYHCRTIVLNQGPFCLSTRLGDLARVGAKLLRADFIYRPYEPQEVRRRWQLIRAGKAVPGSHAANFERGVL